MFHVLVARIVDRYFASATAASARADKLAETAMQAAWDSELGCYVPNAVG